MTSLSQAAEPSALPPRGKRWETPTRGDRGWSSWGVLFSFPNPGVGRVLGESEQGPGVLAAAATLVLPPPQGSCSTT